MILNKKLKLWVRKLSLLIPILFLGVSLSSGIAYASSPGYEATGVLGQSNFTNSSYGNADNQFDYPSSTVIDTVHHRLFVADYDNYRIQVYQLDNNDQIVSQSANYSLGATDPNSIGTDTVTQNSFYDGPAAMAYDPVNNRLFVEDNYRVLVFDLTGGISNNMNASYVIGEPDFTSTNETTSINTMNEPGRYGGGLAFDPTNDRLFVSDYTRVLVFNVSPSSLQTNGNGEDASYVIGQTNFTNANEACTQNELYGGYYDDDQLSLAFDNTDQRLFVSDGYDCSRVLVFNVSPSSLQTNGNGEDASYVIGQPNFTDATYSASQSSLDGPAGIGYDSTNNTLFVGDYYGNSIKLFNVSTAALEATPEGESAYAVIGQPDFTTLNYGTTQSELGYTYYDAGGFAIDPTDNQLFLPDQDNYRILTYNFITMTNSSQLNSGIVGHTYNQTLTSANSQGTVSYSVTSGSLPPGLSLNPSTGLISGVPTTKGSYTFEITAYDNMGTAGTFQDDPSYTIVVAPSATTSVLPPNTGYSIPSNHNPLPTAILYGTIATGIFTVGFGLRKLQNK